MAGNDLDAASGRQPFNAVPQTQGPGAIGEKGLSRDFQPFSEIGARIGGFGDALNTVAEKQAAEDERAGMAAAKAAGAASVMRDADGNVTVGAFDQTTETGRASAATALQSGLLNKQSAVQNDLLALRQQYENDPAGFKAAADAYTKTVGRGDSPEIRPYVRNTAVEYADQHFRSIAQAKDKLDTANAQTGFASRLNDETNALYAMARGSGMQTPDYQAALGRVDDILKALGQNPAYGYPPERVKSEAENIRSKAFGEAVVGEVDRTFDKKGKAEAQRILKDEVLNNSSLNLSEQERGRLYNQGLSRLDFLSGERKSEIDGNKLVVKNIIEAGTAGKQTPDAIVDQVRQKALDLGDADSVLKIDALRSAQKLSAGSQGLTDEQRMVRFGGGAGLRAAPVVQQAFNDAAGKYGIPVGNLLTLGHIETGGRFNPNAQNPTSSAGGLGQFIDRTWEKYGQGKDKYDPQANVDAMARLYLDNRATLKARLGREPELWEIYAAHQQGAAGAGALLSNPNAPALDVLTKVYRDSGVDFASAPSVAARAILGNGGKTSMSAGDFLGIWRDKVQKVAEGYGGARVASAVATDSNPYTAAYALKMQRMDEGSLVPAAQNWAGAITKQVQDGFQPDQTVLASFYQIAAAYPDKLQSTVRDLETALRAQEVSSRALNAEGGIPAAQGVIDAAKKQAADSGNLYEKQVFDHAQSAIDAGVKAMQEEPAREAFTRGWIPAPPAPLDFGNAQALSAAIDDRARAAQVVASRTGQTPSVFGKADMDAVRQGVVGGTAEAASAFVQSLGRLDNDRLYATLADPGMKSALASAANTRDPAKYVAVMGGLDAIWRRNSDEFARTAGSGLFDAVQTYQTRLGETPDTLKKLLVNAADGVDGAYADANRQAAKKDWATYDPRKVGDAVKGWFQWGDRSPQDPRAASSFMGDFLTIYQDKAVQNRGNLDAAKQQTIDKLRTLYTGSSVNGDRLMKLAPETTYRDVQGKPLTIDGSFDWMKDDIQSSLRERLGLRTGDTVEALSEGDGPSFRVPAAHVDYELVPYAGTQAAIAAGSRNPPYMVTFTDPRTGEMHAGYWQGDPTDHLVRQGARLQQALDAKRASEDRNSMSGIVGAGGAF